ncbi:hypothetical protein DV515_00019115 [Chloebia gouldiae]|uniref:Uncharacterized protein n=1 Tax=Chloebia gouldiae TaxID=44316 RepID=A0A3L8Q648_CHLGU|nr:hypothetical protein DV515_00019115 [Chloebia gouldiae]
MRPLECHLEQLNTFCPCRSQEPKQIPPGRAGGQPLDLLWGKLPAPARRADSALPPAPEQCQGHREGVQTQKIPTAHKVNDPSRETQRLRGTGTHSHQGLTGSCSESSARVRRGECSI